MALSVTLGDLSITKRRQLVVASILVSISDAGGTIREETISAAVNPDNPTAKALLLAQLKDRLLALRAEAQVQRSLEAALASLKADLEDQLGA